MRWEYKVSNAPTTPRELQAVLDHDGAEEWELVATTPMASRLILLFKRPAADIQQAEPVEETVANDEMASAEEMESSPEILEMAETTAQTELAAE